MPKRGKIIVIEEEKKLYVCCSKVCAAAASSLALNSSSASANDLFHFLTPHHIFARNWKRKGEDSVWRQFVAPGVYLPWSITM